MRPNLLTRRATLVTVVLLVVGIGGFMAGRHWRTGNVISSVGIADASPYGGTAYIGAHQSLTRPPSGFAYFLPSHVTWIDSTGTVHEGSRPSCLRYYHAERVASMTVTKVPLGEGAYSGTVILVKC